jgi:fibronectin-binding autotransporter adhesin
MAALLFVDPAVPAYESLLTELQSSVDVVIVTRREDVIDQMARRLISHDRSSFDAIHILSHGTDGALQFGSARIDEQTLLDHADDLAAIGARIADDGMIVLYGCEVAKTPHGRAFVQRLAELTGAKVAATTTPTGQTALGGDWLLQYRTGGPAPVIPFDEARRATYPHVLIVPSPFALDALDGTNGFAISGADVGDEAGFAVAAAGDVNGDGLDDFILGARNAHIGIEAHGAAYVVFGTTNGYPETWRWPT